MKTVLLRSVSQAALCLLAVFAFSFSAQARILLTTNSTWRYFKGTSEASTPTNAWRALDFDDSAWLQGTAPFHFGTNSVGGDDNQTGGTILSDMRSNYTCIFLRQTFVIQDTNLVGGLVLYTWHDDGFALWINGLPPRNVVNLIGASLACTNTASTPREANPRIRMDISAGFGTLRNGTNVLCLQAFNSHLTNDDFRTELELTESPSALAFAAASATVNENAGPALVRVVRTGGLGAVTVDYATLNGTALAGQDYVATNGTLTFAQGQTEQTIVVPILNDPLTELAETFQITLSNPVGGASLGTPNALTVTIQDNEVGFQVEAVSLSVSESVGAIGVVVLRGDDLDFPATVGFATLDGTAVAGQDYLATNGTLSFAIGEERKRVAIPILNDGFLDPTESFTFSLRDPTAGTHLGPQATATVTINDNDSGIQFGFTSQSVAEGTGPVLIPVVRGDDVALPVTVDYATTDLSATNGLDYTGATNTLSFAPNERSKLITIPILNDALRETLKAFYVTLSNPTGGALGNTRTITVTIVDNEQGFQLDSANYTVGEDAGVAMISVLRGSDDTNSTVTVDYATSDVTATNGLDYTGCANTLTFAPGEKAKRLCIPILNDGVKEATKSFRVILSNPTGGAVLGSPVTATVSLLDNDPGLGFEVASYSVWEGAGEVNLIVLRGHDANLGPITVGYATSNLTASAGQDYQPISGTLAFQENETVQSLTIPILPDGVVETTESFRVTLSAPTGGAVMGTASTTVNILDASGLAAVPLSPPYNSLLTIRRDGGVNILTWAGGGSLQRADRVTGPWQTLTASPGPYMVHSPIPTTFYRVTSPRPVNLHVPSGYDGQKPMPLVILLHGYGGSGQGQENSLQVCPLAESRGFLYCYPDGTFDQWGRRWWNATDACCDFGRTGVDDAGYLRGVIEEIARRFAVDRKRVYLIGFSNGGFMSHRMACQSADLIAGIASLAGVTFLEPSQCQPSERVNILHVHGTADANVPYAGRAVTTTGLGFAFPANMPPFPGAVRTVQIWAEHNGSSGPVTDPAPSLDLTTQVAGLDTVVTRYTDCRPGGAVELWTVNGAGHNPGLSSQLSTCVIDWLLAHPKP